MDEPTNHLDVSTLFWLEEYLQDYRGAVFTVSHDRYFLDKTVKKIFELENNRLTTFRGNYSKYKILKAEKYEYELKEYERQQEEIASLKEYIDKNIVRATTAKSAQSRVKKLENMTMLERPLPPPKPPVFSFTFGERSEELSLSVNGLTLEAGGKRLFTDAAFEVRRGEKFAVVGENGTGKSTLIRELLKKTHPAVKWGRFVKIGYYDQENANLDGEDTVLGALWFKHTALSQTQARNLLARAKLSEEDVDKKVKSLSGGERAKLSLVLLQAENANFLILDEPTNHLDLAARESLEAALRAFEGTLLFVSHDRYFLNTIPTRIFELSPDGLSQYEGGFDFYLEEKKRREEKRAQEAVPVRRDELPSSYHRSRQERAEQVKRKQRFHQLETQIEEAEERIAALQAEIADP
ncbi:MAG: ABC-F family ATP-binding cassette domain-containing protein, partial [Candidatus Borkfalkia sp.]